MSFRYGEGKPRDKELEDCRSYVAECAQGISHYPHDPDEPCVRCERDAWKTAVLDAAVVNWTYTKEHETNPRKAVNDLLAWESQVALDPAVSEPAAALHAYIKELEAALREIQGRVSEVTMRVLNPR